VHVVFTLLPAYLGIAITAGDACQADDHVYSNVELLCALEGPCCIPCCCTPAVSVLGEAVNGWDAVETELRAAAGHPALELDRVRVATQVRGCAGGVGQPAE
jgi:hypothetical protein